MKQPKTPKPVRSSEFVLRLVEKWKRRSKQLWKHSLTLPDGPALYTRICSKEALRYAQELRAESRKPQNAQAQAIRPQPKS